MYKKLVGLWQIDGPEFWPMRKNRSLLKVNLIALLIIQSQDYGYSVPLISYALLVKNTWISQLNYTEHISGIHWRCSNGLSFLNSTVIESATLSKKKKKNTLQTKKTYLPFTLFSFEWLIMQLLLRGIVILLKIMRDSSEPDLYHNTIWL